VNCAISLTICHKSISIKDESSSGFVMLLFRFCVNLGGNGLSQSLTNYLIIKALVNEIKLQMCVFFRIFVCEFKSEKAPICMAQRYEEIWTYASNRPDKISRD